MHFKNTSTKWGTISQLFHWGVFILLFLNYLLAYTMMELPNSPEKWWFYGMHKQVGVTILLLVALRLWWRMKNTVPDELSDIPEWQNTLARWNIRILYVLLFCFPLSGLAMSLLGGHSVNYFGLFTIPPLVEGGNPTAKFAHTAHELFAYILAMFVGLHILAAAYHHFIRKDDVLRRMLPGG